MERTESENIARRRGAALLALLAAAGLVGPVRAQGLVLQDETYHYGLSTIETDASCAAPLPGLKAKAQTGKLTLRADGSLTLSRDATTVCGDGSSSTLSGTADGTYGVEADGTLRLLLDIAIENHRRFDHGLIGFERSDSGEPTLVVATRVTSSAPPVVGDWWIARMRTIPSAGGLTAVSELGVMTVSPGGAWIEGGTRHTSGPGGTTTTAYSTAGTLAVATDGAVTATRTGAVGTWTGGMAAGGELFFWVEDTGGAAGLTIGVPKAPLGASGALDGSWWSTTLGTATALPQATSTAGALSADGAAGTYSLAGEQVDGKIAGNAQVPFAASGTQRYVASGLLSLTDGVTGAIRAGGLAAHGRAAVLADVSSAGFAEIGFLFRECTDTVPYGTTTAGSGGIAPTLGSSGGLPELGNASFALEVGSGAGGSVAYLLLAPLPSPPLAFAGGAVHVDLGSLILVLPVPLSGAPGAAGAGAATVPFGVPSSPTLAGAHLYLQGLVLDAGAPALLAMTRGLALRFCD